MAPCLPVTSHGTFHYYYTTIAATTTTTPTTTIVAVAAAATTTVTRHGALPACLSRIMAHQMTRPCAATRQGI